MIFEYVTGFSLTTTRQYKQNANMSEWESSKPVWNNTRMMTTVSSLSWRSSETACISSPFTDMYKAIQGCEPEQFAGTVR